MTFQSFHIACSLVPFGDVSPKRSAFRLMRLGGALFYSLNKRTRSPESLAYLPLTASHPVDLLGATTHGPLETRALFLAPKMIFFVRHRANWGRCLPGDGSLSAEVHDSEKATVGHR
uniref:Secreted protein n=1 Tax=Steinernema glaseri TaxID=37863 RepID=A0A1I7Z5L1_9BILA